MVYNLRVLIPGAFLITPQMMYLYFRVLDLLSTVGHGLNITAVRGTRLTNFYVQVRLGAENVNKSQTV